MESLCCHPAHRTPSVPTETNPSVSIATGESTKQAEKTIACGTPDAPGVFVVTMLVCFTSLYTRGCGRIVRPAFRAPSHEGRDDSMLARTGKIPRAQKAPPRLKQQGRWRMPPKSVKRFLDQGMREKQHVWTMARVFLREWRKRQARSAANNRGDGACLHPRHSGACEARTRNPSHRILRVLGCMDSGFARKRSRPGMTVRISGRPPE